jgi:hypothetical protein
MDQEKYHGFLLSKEQADIDQAAREFAVGQFTSVRAIELELNHAFPSSPPWSNIMPRKQPKGH